MVYYEIQYQTHMDYIYESSMEFRKGDSENSPSYTRCLMGRRGHNAGYYIQNMLSYQ